MSLNPPVTDWRGKAAWLVGASSGIGEATAHALHAAGARVFVSARNAAALARFVAAHPGAVAVPLDVTDPPAVQAAARSVLQAGPVDLVLYCAGYYKPQRADHFDLPEMLKHQEINYLGALHVLDAVLPPLLQRGSGHISIVSSVAGYRGLPKGLAYGPTKAALINLAETLYVDLRAAGIGVSLINPGFVQTPATAQNDFEMPALITPAQAAAEILAGWHRGEFEIHFPKRFTRWMKTLQLLPYTAFFALTRRLVKNEVATPAPHRETP
jgi:NAD(P)-dependent dehydrogenase (short-subunit alcohol dehydrogenase family)